MGAMKDSGIEWIGEIPSKWTTKRIKYILDGMKDGTHATFDRVDEGKMLLSAKNVFEDGLHISYNESMISENDYKIIVSNGYPQKGDVLLCCVGTIGRTCVYEYDESMAFQRSVIFLRPSKEIISEYLCYALRTDATECQENLLVNKTAQDGLYMGAARELIITIPSTIDEQKEIVSFLNEKCTKIDDVIADITKQIELLQQYKKSLITETVTKGLDKSVPMKDSGVEWIGEIPEKWDVKRLKYCLRTELQYGANESGNDYCEDYPRYIRITDIDNNNTLKEEGIISLEPTMAKPYLLEDGDVLFARSGATVGKTFYYSQNLGSAAFAGYLIRAQVNEQVIARYLFYITLGNYYDAWKNMVFSQATIQNIGADKYVQLPVIMPTIKEQQEIVKFLDKKCTQIDSILESKQKQLETITEHKKSLIYEYVTGKKRVKEVQ